MYFKLFKDLFLNNDDKNEKIKRINTNFVKKIKVFSALAFLFIIGCVISIILSSLALAKEKKYVTQMYASDNTTTKTTTTPKKEVKINECSIRRKFNETNLLNKIDQTNLIESFTKTFNEDILAFDMVCFGKDTYFVLHLGSRIILLNYDNFEIEREYKGENAWNLKKIEMIATKRHVVISENSEYLYTLDFDLENLKNINLNKNLTPIHLSTMFYDADNDKLIVYQVNYGFLYLNSSFGIESKQPFNKSEPIMFYQTTDGKMIYYGSTSSSKIGNFNLSNNAIGTESSACNYSMNLVSFSADDAGIILTVCSTINENDKLQSSVIIMKEKNVLYNFTTIDYKIKRVIQDLNGQLIATTYFSENFKYTDLLGFNKLYGLTWLPQKK